MESTFRSYVLVLMVNINSVLTVMKIRRCKYGVVLRNVCTNLCHLCLFLIKMAGIEEEMAENRAIYYLFIIGVRSFFITFVLMNCILCY